MRFLVAVFAPEYSTSDQPRTYSSLHTTAGFMTEYPVPTAGSWT
jgi:hypothetical protein